jgi:hypothetical protein
MFKGFNNRQLHGFPNIIFQGDISAYGFGGVSFWLDAAFGLNTQTNLGAVNSWQQRVGGGTFIQATAGNQPRLILNDPNFNNFPSVEAQDNARRMTASNGLKFNPQITVAIISKINSANTVNSIIADREVNNRGIFDGGTGAGWNGFGYWATTVQLQGTTENTNARIKIITSTDVIINGSVESTGSIGTTFQELTSIFNGASNGATSATGIGTIAEIIAFGYSMTSANAIQLSNNINQKYVIY